MFRVGLTGGIGCGKSAAADMFAALGAEVVDTDAIAHELTGPHGGAMQAIEQAFGADYVRADGGLDRARMRNLVFGDPQSKARLESILHPRIREEANRRMHASRAPYVVLVVPLLIETGAYRDVLDRIVVVDCDEARQVERVAARSALSEEEIRRIMRAQVSRDRRLASADDVLANDGDMLALRTQVAALHARYVEAARSAP